MSALENRYPFTRLEQRQTNQPKMRAKSTDMRAKSTNMRSTNLKEDRVDLQNEGKVDQGMSLRQRGNKSKSLVTR